MIFEQLFITLNLSRLHRIEESSLSVCSPDAFQYLERFLVVATLFHAKTYIKDRSSICEAFLFHKLFPFPKPILISGSAMLPEDSLAHKASISTVLDEIRLVIALHMPRSCLPALAHSRQSFYRYLNLCCTYRLVYYWEEEQHQDWEYKLSLFLNCIGSCNRDRSA